MNKKKRKPKPELTAFERWWNENRRMGLQRDKVQAELGWNAALDRVACGSFVGRACTYILSLKVVR